MTTTAIIGAGDLGGSIAHAIARRESADRVVIVDAAGRAAAGKALDIFQSGAIAGHHTRLDGTDDFSQIIGCSVCIVADQFGPPAAEWHGDHALAMLTRIRPFTGDAPILLAGALQGPMLLSAVREAGYPRGRVIGSSVEALAAAVRSIVAMEAGCSPTEVMLTVLGTPPSGFVVPWSEASIGGHALERVLSTVQLSRVVARAGRLWPPGPYALGLAAAITVEAMRQTSRRAVTALTVLDGEFGVRDRIGAQPVLLSPQGVIGTRDVSLSTRERVMLGTALGPT
jgi:malate dehydrogenase